MSRNYACKDAIEKGFTRLLFLDSDLVHRWIHLERCIESGHEIACGTYAHKDIKGLVLCNNPIDSEGPDDVQYDDLGFARVQEAGTGFMLIKVPLLERMIATGKVPQVIRDGTQERVHAFFQFATMHDRMMSEDWYFCASAFALCEERPWADLKTLIAHIGYIAYPLPQFMPPNAYIPAST